MRKGQKLKDRLAREGLIEEFEERISTGRIRRIRLTEKGEKKRHSFALCNEKGVDLFDFLK